MNVPRIFSGTIALSGVLFLLSSASHAQDFIRPGQAIGKVQLGASYDEVMRQLGGKPAASDAAMGGKLWATWYDAPSSDTAPPPPPDVRQVNVYFQREVVRGEPSGTARVRAVQVNSPYFHTVPGTITPGLSTLAAIQLAYPTVQRVSGTFTLQDGQADFYQDARKGIGFLVKRATPAIRGTCQAILIFPPGTPFRPYLSTP